MANRRTTVEVNGVDVTDQFDAVALQLHEQGSLLEEVD